MWFSSLRPDEVLKAAQDEFMRRQAKNPGYSIRAFARDLDIEHTSLWRVLNGQRNLHWPMAKQLIEKLDLQA